MSQKEAVQPGDVLRACTCTNFVFPTQSLFGAKPPVRTLVVYGADDQRWPKVIGALKKGAWQETAPAVHYSLAPAAQAMESVLELRPNGPGDGLGDGICAGQAYSR